jgi:hypothetical protein
MWLHLGAYPIEIGSAPPQAIEGELSTALYFNTAYLRLEQTTLEKVVSI